MADVVGGHADRSDESLLACASQGGPERDALVEEVVLRHLGLARRMARRYRDRSVALDDLEQVACLALVRAASDFDPARGHDFLSYAVPTIRGSLRRHFRDHGWAIRPPRRVQELQLAALEAVASLEGPDNRSAIERVAEQLGAEPREIEEALTARGCFVPDSLDFVPGSADGAPAGPVGDLLPDPGHPTDLAAEARVILGAVVPQLDETARLVLFRRYFEQRPQREIAEELGTTQMTVSRMISRILAELRGRIGEPAA